MTALRLSLCLSALLLPFAAPRPPAFAQTHQAMRSGAILGCEATAHCVREIIDGKPVYRVETPRFIIRVALQPFAHYTDVYVRVTNRTGAPFHLNPAEFRIETDPAGMKHLTALEPARLKLPNTRTIAFAAPSRESSFPAAGAGEPPHPQSATLFLTALDLAPNVTAEGHVFFERTNRIPSMSLILPVAGSVFGFDYSQTKD